MNQIAKLSKKNVREQTQSDTEVSGSVVDIVHELDKNLLNILRSEGPLTRSRLVKITGVARSTLYDSLLRLIVKGYVTSYSEERKKRGRPKVYYEALL